MAQETASQIALRKCSIEVGGGLFVCDCGEEAFVRSSTHLSRRLLQVTRGRDFIDFLGMRRYENLGS